MITWGVRVNEETTILEYSTPESALGYVDWYLANMKSPRSIIIDKYEDNKFCDNWVVFLDRL